MDSGMIRNYANVLLTAVNLQKGQGVLIRAQPVHLDFAAVLAREAYKRGARYVRFDNNEVDNPAFYKARIEHSVEEYLDYAPRSRYEPYGSMLEEDWAIIAIHTPEDPDFLSTLDPARNARCVRATTQAMQPYRRRIAMDNEVAWLVAFAPTQKMAARILGMEAGPEAVEALWKVLVPILRLDAPDPSEAWRRHCGELAARAERLNALALDHLRFTGPGTDLSVGLLERSRWRGGPEHTKTGRLFYPNIPTEEVFTTPDARRTEGRAAFTRPVLVPSIGKTVVDGWLEFRGGRVTDYGARSGKDVLDTFLSMDEGARSLGEVALVDGASPVFASGRVFYNILFDENAASHVALGSAYSACVSEGEGLGDEEMAALGANVSMVHTDFMIGSPEVDVAGVTRDGRTVKIMSRGAFLV